MKIGMIGLGKMGGNMRDRLRRAGHEVVGYDLDEKLRDADSLEAMVAELDAPRVVWVMVPHGKPTRTTVETLGELLSEGDLVVEGGNSKFTEDVELDQILAPKGIGYVDCGVSGGVWGLENGYGLMCGGRPEHVEIAMPIFDALRPEGPREEGFVHAGEVGAGHYAKMVHNGIEYGLMQAYSEGYELLAAKDIVKDVKGCFQAWSRGTVVRSWLLDLLVKALDETPELKGVSAYTTDSGEGRWTVEEAIEMAVPMPVISAALFARFASRQENSPAMQMVSALRGQFGGHAVKLLDDPRLDEGQVEVHQGAEAKQDGGHSAPPQSSGSGASDAGPSSGTGSTTDTDGPTSGTRDATDHA
ncbi:MAG: decarboxylating 6-phosphogluconate dehydrogenase [Ornithinimicrobium sp.]|uniref:phosphogluconate dehydrogenase (NAD(+)-dependent, decarboxylating) n=1 Tax=Ornithinimicrobium sp. TaxID=1977084 RepID=UPI0026DED6C1|nr:decarboxylating 6-phosphogluconate dehydrogenase [Ornithinimicrobium sp.]MDO5739169.1 decarboxylating 6-phosphogluconate dehydrogenase [Ornithinimicrobium sp.]